MSTRTVTPGSTDQSIAVWCYDADGEPVTLTSASAGLTLAFRRDTNGREGTPVALTPVARSGAGVHTDGAITHVGAGKHEIDVTDAACAAGTRVTVVLELAATGVDMAVSETLSLEKSAQFTGAV